ncbi:unnamed protein product [Orchesella dallaii]|uniref:C2H2-type domain-containing protein n=1 Tax=Orchesella dallaii TaxID=48710 RepID=A0ABP1RW36_9HEXA
MNSTSNCIFCISHCPPSFTVSEDRKPIKVKIKQEENDTQNQPFFSTSCCWNISGENQDDSSIDSHLKVIFILRNLLNIEKQTCSSFLEKNEGHLHPEFWMSVCSSCDQLVKEFWEKLREIGRLERRVKAIKTKLVGFVRNTRGYEDNLFGNEAPPVWKEIRDSVEADGRTAADEHETRCEPCSDNEPIEDSPAPSPSSPPPQSESDFEMENDDEEEDDPQSKEEELKPKKCYYKCSSCGDLSANMVRYRQHQLLHHLGKGVKCPECGWLCQKLPPHFAHWHSKTGDRTTFEEKIAKRIIKEVKCSRDPPPPAVDPAVGMGMQVKLDIESETITESSYKTIPKGKGKQRYLQCNFCPGNYPKLFQIKNHLQLHKSGKGVPCEKCGWVVEFNKMGWHIRHRHLKSKNSTGVEVKRKYGNYVKKNYRYDCNDCPASYRSLGDLNEHKRLHENGEGVVCPECGWLVAKLGQHNGKHHPQTSKGDKKRIKLEDLSKKSRLLVTEEIPYYCDHCQMIYPTINRLVTHVKAFHAGEPLRNCEKCKFQFESKQLLRRHLVKDHGEAEEEEQEEEEIKNCEHCSKEFESKLKLDLHIAKEHQDRLLFCGDCNLLFRKFGDYQRHMNASRFHANQKGFACELCGKSYVSNWCLQNHRQKDHYKELGMEPLYKCPECGKVLGNKTNLDLHIRSLHTKIFIFTCEYCGKGFNLHHRLVEHKMKKHKDPDKK